MIFSFKIAVLGNEEVGKSSLINQLHNGEISPNIPRTIGANFSVFRCIDSENLKDMIELQIWDISGNERFSSLLPLYLRDVSAVLIVFAFNDSKSQKDSVSKWLSYNEVKQCSTIFYIGNKRDLIFTEEDDLFYETLVQSYKTVYVTSAMNHEDTLTVFLKICAQLRFRAENNLIDNLNVINQDKINSPAKKCCFW